MLGWLRRVASYIPGLLTLAVLGGVGLWGVRNDWRLPTLAALQGQESSTKEEDADAVKVVAMEAPPTPVDPEFPAELLKEVRFPSEDAVAKTGIAVAKADVRPMAQYVTANAMLDYVPSRYVELHSPVQGRIWSVERELGAPVKKGDVLVVIDAAEVGKVKADFLQGLAQVHYRNEVLQRLQAARTSLSEQRIFDEQAALREARARLLADQQWLLNLGFAVRLKDFEGLAQEEAGRQLRLLGLPETVRHRVDPDTLTANLLPLTAPFDGQVVTHPHAAPGQLVGTAQSQNGEPLFVVADIRELHIDLEVHVEDAPHLRVGQAVRFDPANANGTPATGEIAHISPEVNEKTRNVQVHAEVANTDGRLRPHTFGTGRVLIRQEPEAVVVPTEALQSEGRFSFVFVRVAPDTFQVRAVQPGLRDGQFTAVRGVAAGDEVVTAGSYVLKSELFKERIAGD
jgi:cobalt-zinc-cadmium efflux system membrane fusion protein